MRSVTYSMNVSLDGYIVGPDGDFNWTAPDEEVFRFVTDERRAGGATSRSAARVSPPRRPRRVGSTRTGPGSTRCWSAVP
jgi:hypothetical protein